MRRRAGESNSQTGWSPAVRFRSGWAHPMPRPSRLCPCGTRLVAAPTRFELAVFAVTGRRGLHSPTRPCLLSATRSGAGRYASRGSNPDDRSKSPARWPLRERRVGGGGWTCTSGSFGGRVTGGGLRCSATPPWAAGVAARLPCCWHLCTGGWSLRGDVRGTCPRSPCTVPAMCADVSPSTASSLTAGAVPAPGRSLLWWSLPPVPVSPAVVSVVVSVSEVTVSGPHAEEPPPLWLGAAPLRILDAGRVS